MKINLAMPIIGTFGYEPHQRTFFGLNRGIEAHGMYMNVYVANVVQAKNGNKDQNIAFSQQLGMLGSALEHLSPEQLFSNSNESDPLKQHPKGFSTAKALAMADKQGQRIYTITPITQNIALPHIRLDADSMNEIRAALASGKHVTTHTDLLTVPGFKGAGYVITDPDTGAGVYKITGGKNGGFILGAIFGAALMSIIGLYVVSFPVSEALIVMLLPIIAPVIGVMVENIVNLYTAMEPDVKDCFISGFLMGTGIGLVKAGATALGALFSRVLEYLGYANVALSFTALPNAKACLFE